MDHPKRETLVPELRILLWSAPRCCSSVFERSVRELKTVKVIYEPHQRAFYYGPERRTDDNILTVSDIDPSATFQAADAKLLLPYSEHQAVFAKNHAYFLEGRYEECTEGIFAKFKHTFLIRHPNCKQCGFPPCPSDNGFKQLFDLFKTVQEVDPHPIVIDADDLLTNARVLMEQYCTATGLPFEERMLNWTPGVVPDWTEIEHYKEWHGTVMMSTGFMKPKEALLSSTTSLPEEAEDAEDAVQQALPLYEAMYAVRMKPYVLWCEIIASAHLSVFIC